MVGVSGKPRIMLGQGREGWGDFVWLVLRHKRWGRGWGYGEILAKIHHLRNTHKQIVNKTTHAHTYAMFFLFFLCRNWDVGGFGFGGRGGSCCCCFCLW